MDDWKKELAGRFRAPDDQERQDVAGVDEQRVKAEMFYASVASPALAELKRELERYGRQVEVKSDLRSLATITVRHQGKEEFFYDIRVKIGPTSAMPYAVMRYRGKPGGTEYHDMASAKPASEVTKADIIRHFMEHYRP